MFSHNFIYNPDPYLLPGYKISPFSTQDVSFNRHLPPGDMIDSYFKQRFSGRSFIYTENGRSAISAAIRCLGLQKEDCITLLTTSGNFYISGCVTREIEKYCGWSRQMEKNTRAIFVNHEFGFCYENLAALKQYGLPIIEDCAHSFLSDNLEKTTSRVGDFTVFSFPKFFPVQCGGMLLFNPDLNIKPEIDADLRAYIQKVLSYYIGQSEDFSLQRRKNYQSMAKLFGSLGMPARFEFTEESIPGVFMFRVEDEQVDLPALKSFLWKQGIECSVFYGERSFFLPVHNRLTDGDLEYFFEAVRFFLSEREQIP